jgi:predicted metal-dependent hydrolase
VAIEEHGTAALVLPDGEEVLVRVRQSDHARTTRIRLGPRKRPEIILAAEAHPTDASRLLEHRSSWIANKLAAVRALGESDELGLEATDRLPLDGQLLPVDVRWAKRPTARRTPDGRVCACGPDEEAIVAALERWYRREARILLGHMLEHEAQRLRIGYRRLTVRDPKRRWGSCSSAGDISLSWRLVLTPASVRRYVVVHELLHVRVPSHSRAFWRSVEIAYPGWRESVSWLSRHGSEVRRFRCDAAARAGEPRRLADDSASEGAERLDLPTWDDR